MLHTTRGIVLQTFSYTDSSVITKIYTELFGLQSYLVNAAHSRRSATRAGLLQPLTLVECVVYKKEKKQLQRIKEIKCAQPYADIPHNIAKSSIALFLNEILCKSIREEECDQQLYEFIHHSLLLLDLSTASCANFHLYFMLRLSRHLGFFPSNNFSASQKYFDLQEGFFKTFEPHHALFISPLLAEKLNVLMNSSFENIAALPISAAERKQLLENLITYYELHIPALRNVRSHKVLEEIF